MQRAAAAPRRRASALLLAALIAMGMLAVWWRCGAAPRAPAANATTTIAQPAQPVGDAANTRTISPAAAPPFDITAHGAHGRCVDRDGAPVANALVTCVEPAPATPQQTRTDEQGAFRFAIAPVAGARLLLAHPDFVLANVAAPATPATLPLQRRPIVRGIVVDDGDRPIARFGTALLAERDAHGPLAAPPPDTVWQQRDDGTFTMRAEAGGPHDLAVFADAFAPRVLPLELRADDIATVRVQLHAGVRCAGVVRDAEGNAVAGARVQAIVIATALAADGAQPATGANVLGLADATTAADGTFALAALPAGTLQFVVDADERPQLRGERTLPPPPTPPPFLDLRLPAPAAASGVVTPWTPGRSASVVFVHANGTVRRAPVDAQHGTWSLLGLTPGQHRALVEGDERTWRQRVVRQLHGLDCAPAFELPAGRMTRCDVVDLAASMARVRGRVRGSDAPQDLRVTGLCTDRALPERVQGLYRATPLADGTFVLDALLPGHWRLELWRGDTVVGSLDLDVAAGAEVDCELNAR